MAPAFLAQRFATRYDIHFRMNDAQFAALAAWITDAGLAGESEIATLAGFCERVADLNQRNEPDRRLCRSVDQPLLVSSAFASALGEPKKLLVSVGRYALRGVARAQDLFTLEGGADVAIEES
jgi:hypothetical protein